MDVPAVYDYIKRLPGCDGGNLRFMMGHLHCNKVHKPDVGYLLGATGLRGSGCDSFGFAYVDSTAAREQVVHFELANSTMDRFDEVVDCFETQGVARCVHLGEVWRNTTL